MPVVMADLLADLRAESDDLDALLAPRPADAWELPTPAAGWAVRDQVSHLAAFDEVTTRQAGDPDAFRAEVDELWTLGDDFTEHVARSHRGRAPDDLLRWFRTARTTMIDVFSGVDPTTMLPWFGPPMSAASSMTARLMETWAHGQDVADALGVVRTPTARLGHVAHLGVATRGFALGSRGLPADDPVHVALAAPDGSTWRWGPSDARDTVRGPALDFCLLVTRRRHRDDLALEVSGPAAHAWVDVAQAFAGPPGADPLRQVAP